MNHTAIDTILAPDVGKFKTVACYDASSVKARLALVFPKPRRGDSP